MSLARSHNINYAYKIIVFLYTNNKHVNTEINNTISFIIILTTKYLHVNIKKFRTSMLKLQNTD